MDIEERSGLAGRLGALLGIAVCASCSSPGEPLAVDASARDLRASTGRPTTLADGPANLRGAYIASRQADGLADPRFRVIADPLGLRTARHGGFDARFDGTGVALRTDGGVAGRLETDAIRCDGRELIGPGSAPVIDPAGPHRVTRRAGAGATEWYVNGPLGLEHGFDLELGGCDRSLSIDVATPGFVPAMDGDDVRLTSRGTGVALRYAALSAYDGEGRSLPASFDVGDARIVISVDVAEARGPITIDPLIYVEEQRVSSSGDAIWSGDFGDTVALSGDTALVASPHEEFPGGLWQGAVYFFVRSGTTWSQQARFTLESVGSAVALSGDMALVGSPFEPLEFMGFQGAAHVFVRSGNTWSQQGLFLSAPGFGAAVALSGDTVLVGTLNQEADVFVLTDAGWSHQTLTASDRASGDDFGLAVAVSGDTVLVGADGDDIGGNQDQGSAYIFVRSGTTWSQQAKVTASDGAAFAHFGSRVALSGDTALVAASGAAYVFVRSGAEWSQQAKLTVDGGAPGASLGGGVALSGDTALVGAEARNTGSAYAFVRRGATWSQQAKLTAGHGMADENFGHSVALSGSLVSGYLTAVGAPSSAHGAVYFGSLTTTEPCFGVAAGTTCRASAGPCDVAETCDGVNEACPPDRFVAAGTACPASSDVCDGAGTCTGTGADCADEPDGTVFGVPAPCDASGGCCGAGGGRTSFWLGLVVLAWLSRRRVRAPELQS